MMNQKDIDRLFQEGLRDFEASPSPDVWQQIEHRLTHKKKKRIIPFFWWSSAAVILIVGLLFINPKEGNNDNVPNITFPIVTDSSESEDKNENTNNKVEVVVHKELKKEKNYIASSKKETITTKKIAQFFNQESISSTSPKKLIKRTIHQFKTTEFLSSKIIGNEKKPLSKTSLISFLEKENIEKKEPVNKKWAIQPSLAYTKSNSLSNESSPVSDMFSSNVSGQSSVAYGVKIKHSINEKLAIQTGVHSQKLNFNTDVNLYTNTIVSNNLSNISFDNDAEFYYTGSGTAGELVEPIGPSGSIVDDNASLEQIIGYIEIPVELSYKIFSSKKINTHIVGGFSSLFLNKNQVNLKSNIVEESQIGKTNNLKSVNFSGNIGLDVTLSITKDWNLSINPMLKAQLNTFSNNTQFTPYFLAVYTGVSYSF